MRKLVVPLVGVLMLGFRGRARGQGTDAPGGGAPWDRRGLSGPSGWGKIAA
jgi:hypothetical protein